MHTPWGKRAQVTDALRADVRKVTDQLAEASAAALAAFGLVALVALVALGVATAALLRVRDL